MCSSIIKNKIQDYMTQKALNYTNQDLECIYWIIQGILCYKIFKDSFIEEAVLCYINK